MANPMPGSTHERQSRRGSRENRLREQSLWSEYGLQRGEIVLLFMLLYRPFLTANLRYPRPAEMPIGRNTRDFQTAEEIRGAWRGA